MSHATGLDDAVGRAVVWECPGRRCLSRRCRLGPGIAPLPVCEGLAGGPPIAASALGRVVYPPAAGPVRAMLDAWADVSFGPWYPPGHSLHRTAPPTVPFSLSVAIDPGTGMSDAGVWMAAAAALPGGGRGAQAVQLHNAIHNLITHAYDGMRPRFFPYPLP